MDNIPEDAAFCDYCHQPFDAENVETSSRPEQVYLDLDNSLSEKAISSIAGDERIDVADPIDFIMSQNNPPDEPTDPSKETPDKSPTEKTPTLLPKKDLEAVKFESAGGTSAAVGIAVQPPKEEKEEPKPQQPAQQETGSSGDETNPDDSKGEEEKTATRKIETPSPKKQFGPVLSVARPSIEKTPFVELGQVTRSRGVILLAGEKLTLTGGTKVFPGDEIRIGDRTYEVKPKPRDRKKTIGMIAGAATLLIILLLFIGGFIPIGSGRLIGVVIGGPDNRPLPGQTVRIDEINRTVTTDQAGFFVFDDLKSGLYTIQYLRDGIPAASERIAVIDNEITTLTLFESKSESSVPRDKTPAATGQTMEKQEVQSQNRADHGTLKLSVTPNDAMVYLDDKPLGNGSNSYNIKSGKYVLSVKKRGYETKSRDIAVKVGKTSSYDFALAKADKDKKKTDGELAYENEISGNYHEALRYYDKILNRSPKDIRATLGKARCCRAQGLTEQAITYYTQAASVAAVSGDLASQIDALTGIIEIRPNTLTAYSGRGDVFFSQGEYAKAAQDYETVVTMDRRNLGALYKLGNAYYYARDYNRALSAFKAAEELNFADPRAYVHEAKTYLMMGDQKNMRKSYEKCKELSTYAARLEFKNDPDWQKVLDALGVKE